MEAFFLKAPSMAAPPLYSPKRQHFPCPHCQQALLCSVGGFGHPPPNGWPDAPSFASFYEVLLDPPETHGAVLLGGFWCVDSQTQCPRCEQPFNLEDAGVTEPEELGTTLEEKDALDHQANWNKSYTALEAGRLSKSDEFKARLELWRRSNEKRRSNETLRENIVAFPVLFFAMMASLLSGWHLKWASASSLLGLSIAYFQGQDWQGCVLLAALFALVPASLFVGVFSLLTPFMIFSTLFFHFGVYRARKQWRTTGSPYRKNLAALLPFFDESKPMERLVKAEGHRQLGQFEEALALIEQGLPEHLENYSLSLTYLCQNRMDQFIYWDSFKEATDETALAAETALD
ncbi:MAG: hypothetical protein P1V97_12455 [Planctomycetota bacterium]|nr:hypothetical protein [Planctomycetota bacterium]